MPNTLILLRILRSVARPFRVPLSTTACAIALIPTVAALILVIALASYTTICVNATTIGVGMLVYSFSQRSIEQNNNYVDEDADKASEVC